MFYKPPARLLSPPWKRTFTGSPRSQERSRREQPLARHLGGSKEEKKRMKLKNKDEKDGINLLGTARGWLPILEQRSLQVSLFADSSVSAFSTSSRRQIWSGCGCLRFREKMQNIWETKSTGVGLRAAHGLVVGERSNRRGI